MKAFWYVMWGNTASFMLLINRKSDIMIHDKNSVCRFWIKGIVFRSSVAYLLSYVLKVQNDMQTTIYRAVEPQGVLIVNM
jgi:hypothetical protein